MRRLRFTVELEFVAGGLAVARQFVESGYLLPGSSPAR
jgi:hypothetical protein